MIDTLASEYGWTKSEILRLYKDEIAIIIDQIAKRKSDEHKIRLMELAQSACVPHFKPEDRKKFFSMLEKTSGFNNNEANVDATQIKKQLNAVKKRFNF